MTDTSIIDWLGNWQELISGLIALLAALAGTIIDWLYNWQALAGGLMALGAALAGTVYLRRQITQAERHEENRLARRRRAMRAVLPVTLGKIIGHVRGTAKLLSSKYDSASKPAIGKALLQPDEAPRLDPSVIGAIAAMIEAEGDEKIGQHLAKIAARLQILT